MKDLVVVVVSYNTREVLAGCLKACQRAIAELDAQIVVVDNASHDGSVDMLKRDFPQVKVIASPYNLGFAAANNLAVAQTPAHHYLLLNSDAFTDPDAVGLALNYLKTHDNVAMVGGLLLNEWGQPEPSARLFPSLTNDLLALSGLSAKYPKSKFFGRFDRTWSNQYEPCFPDWVPGAFALIRGSVYRELSGFDERFFLYYEEVDLCRRIQALGLRVAYRPECRAVHIGGQSSRQVQDGVVSKNGSQLTAWRMRAGMLYYRKHHGWLGAKTMYWLEKGWHSLRRLKNVRRNERAQESAWTVNQLQTAWDETRGGRVSPPTPW